MPFSAAPHACVEYREQFVLFRELFDDRLFIVAEYLAESVGDLVEDFAEDRFQTCAQYSVQLFYRVQLIGVQFTQRFDALVRHFIRSEDQVELLIVGFSQPFVGGDQFFACLLSEHHGQLCGDDQRAAHWDHFRQVCARFFELLFRFFEQRVLQYVGERIVRLGDPLAERGQRIGDRFFAELDDLFYELVAFLFFFRARLIGRELDSATAGVRARKLEPVRVCSPTRPARGPPDFARRLHHHLVRRWPCAEPSPRWPSVLPHPTSARGPPPSGCGSVKALRSLPARIGGELGRLRRDGLRHGGGRQACGVGHGRAEVFLGARETGDIAESIGAKRVSVLREPSWRRGGWCVLQVDDRFRQRRGCQPLWFTPARIKHPAGEVGQLWLGAC